MSSDGRMQLHIGNITKLEVDAIVNAANRRMLGGGGVDGAIHRVAGPELMEACRAVEEVEPDVRCPTGDARITPGFKLPAKHVIHTVGPVYSGKSQDAELLASCYRSALTLAAEHGVETIAFPCISTGIYGYPKDEAADIALAVVRKWLDEHDMPRRVTFCCFSEDDGEVYRSRMN